MTALCHPTCPGLAIGDEGLVWIDSLGHQHRLASAKRVSLGAVATRLGRDVKTVRRYITDGKLYPVVRHSTREVELYDVGVDDYLARRIMADGGAKR